ncbi:hypothetical protein [Arthrobacter sp. ISL-30]|nr:hypothetical protein [Arthrobacter sp. ISL-30]MBT2512551.1 hypothetical protein [Arthrobacter sp. ISL-30]
MRGHKTPLQQSCDVDGTRKVAEADLSDAAIEFAGKLSAAGTLQLVND